MSAFDRAHRWWDVRLVILTPDGRQITVAETVASDLSGDAPPIVGDWVRVHGLGQIVGAYATEVAA